MKIKEIISKQLGQSLEEVTDEANLKENLLMDSLDCVELTMAFEEELGVEISDEDAEAWKTVADVIAYLESKVG